MGFTHARFAAYLVRYNGLVNLGKNKPKEHDGYKWVLFKKALELLTFSTSKSELRAAHAFMKSKGIV